MKKRIVGLALVLVMAFSAVPIAMAAQFPFTDVPQNHRHRRAVEFCFTNDFVRGVTPTTFNPNGQLTREHFALIWARTLRARMHRFTDVQRITDEADNAIILMQALRHINGVSDTLFSRRSPITREQALTIAYRAYIPGVDGHGAEDVFTDQAQISSWARNAVGALQSKGLLSGVFEGTALHPHRAISRSETAQLIYNIISEERAVTIAPMTGGTVTANATHFRAGATVTLTVTPNSGMRLREGSLRFDNTPVTGGTFPTYTFMMPNHNVTITAEFEPIGHSITVDSAITGGTITPNVTQAQPGATVTLTVTPNSGMRLVAGSLRANDTVITTGTAPTFTFTMPSGNVVIHAQFEPINALESIAVTTPPDTVTFTEGATLNLTGIVVTATYADGTTRNVTNYITTSPAAGAALTTTGAITVTITHTEHGVTRTTTQTITVTAV